MSDDIAELRAEVRAELTEPGGFFEVTTEDVRDIPMQVFKDRKRSVRELVAGAAAHGDNEFMVMGERRVSHAEFVDLVASVAAALEDRYDIGPGDRVAIFAANRPEWVITFYATVSLGGIVAAFNGWWTATEVAHALELTEPKLIVGDRSRLTRVMEVPDDTLMLEMETEFVDLEEHPADGLPDNPIAEDDPALILFTSGTTGRSKGALISHRGLVGFVQATMCAGAERIFLASRLGDERSSKMMSGQMRTLMTSPLFHVSGLFGSTLLGSVVGSCLVFREGRFDPADVLRLMEAEGITSWAALGSMGPRVLACPDIATTDLSTLNNVSFGGAPVSPTLRQRILDAFPNAGIGMGSGYGSSESVGVIAMIGGRDFDERPTSTGRLSPTFEMQIRGPDGDEVPAGVDGEVWVRSPYTMLGYWRNEEATAETIDSQQWLNTGDIGRVDDGFLYLNSRARDMILRAAENVYPVEIELRIDAHPDIVESAVVGVDHPELGQEVKAFVVLRPGARLDGGALATWVGEELAPYKVPSQWELRDEPLPRNAAGKVIKPVLTGDRTLDQIEE